jgi:hypothetical protein
MVAGKPVEGNLDRHRLRPTVTSAMVIVGQRKNGIDSGCG